METEKYFEKYQEELDKNYEIWIKNEKWAGKLNIKHGKKIAICLENQRLFAGLPHISQTSDEDLIEKTYEMFQHFIGFDIVSSYPMLGPGANVYFKKNDKLESAGVYAKTRILKSLVSDSDAKSIAHELNSEIIDDIRSFAGSVMSTCKTTDLKIIKSMIKDISEQMVQNDNRWIITTPEVAKVLTQESTENIFIDDLNNKYNVFSDLAYPNEILVGSQDDMLNGYFYNPYVTLCRTPRLNIEGFCPTDRYFTRYSKKLISDKFYGRIVFKYS
jgi:hypothetical protein